MDVVYTVARARTYEELRYSLRSLCNLTGVDQVWIVGASPSWAENVRTLATRPKQDRYKDTSNSVRRAIGCVEVSDPFLLFNDDFFAMRPVAHADYDRGPLADYLRSNRKPSLYRNAALGAYNTLVGMGFEDPLNFEMHAPITVHKKLMDQALKMSDGWKRSMYGNMALAEGAIETSTRDDVKIMTNASPPENADWVSTSDKAFRSLKVGQVIRDLFPAPSVYEGGRLSESTNLVSTTGGEHVPWKT